VAATQSDVWETTDLTTAAYLRAIDIRYEEMRAENGEVIWSFVRCPELTEAIAQYSMGEASVEPEEFSRQLLKLRRRMFDVLDGRASA